MYFNFFFKWFFQILTFRIIFLKTISKFFVCLDFWKFLELILIFQILLVFYYIFKAWALWADAFYKFYKFPCVRLCVHFWGTS